jgi:hypothetical protein
MYRAFTLFIGVTLLAACGGTGSTAGSGGGGTANTPVGGNTASTVADNVVAPLPESQESSIDSEATSFFFSYDESASTASRDLALTALQNGTTPDASLGRAYEFLNAENFSGFGATAVGPFDVSMGMLLSENGDIPLTDVPDGSVYGLGVNIAGPERTLAERRNVVLTVLLDLSGSMDSQYAAETVSEASSLLDVAKVGLIEMQQSLKAGDVINIVTFSTDANVVLEAHNAEDNNLTALISDFFTQGSTNIGAGVTLAYEVANRTYDPGKANRVLMITDAFVNTGELDPDAIAAPTVINGLEGIYFSGIGVGASFNDQVLNLVTEAGKGSYSAMITPADARRIFTDGFFRFLNPAARDVRFQLTYPQELDQLLSFAEEISTEASDVRTINFSYNSSQFFLEVFRGTSSLTTDQEIRLDVTYKDEEGNAQSASVTRSIAQMLGQGERQIRAASAVTSLAQLINGRLACDTVLSSNLYNNRIDDAVYVAYINHIDDFCGQ